jgi:hypothetical protein
MTLPCKKKHPSTPVTDYLLKLQLGKKLFLESLTLFFRLTLSFVLGKICPKRRGHGKESIHKEYF